MDLVDKKLRKKYRNQLWWLYPNCPNRLILDCMGLSGMRIGNLIQKGADMGLTEVTAEQVVFFLQGKGEKQIGPWFSTLFGIDFSRNYMYDERSAIREEFKKALRPAKKNRKGSPSAIHL